MDSLSIPTEKNNSLNKDSMPISQNYIFNDIFSFVFGLILVGVTSHLLNEGDVLMFSEQLAIIGKPNFIGVLIASTGVFLFFKILKDVVLTAKEGKIETSKFSSIWTPIRFAILTSFLMPFEQNGNMTSTVVETMKWIIQFVAN